MFVVIYLIKIFSLRKILGIYAEKKSRPGVGSALWQRQRFGLSRAAGRRRFGQGQLGEGGDQIEWHPAPSSIAQENGQPVFAIYHDDARDVIGVITVVVGIGGEEDGRAVFEGQRCAIGRLQGELGLTRVNFDEAEIGDRDAAAAGEGTNGEGLLIAADFGYDYIRPSACTG